MSLSALVTVLQEHGEHAANVASHAASSFSPWTVWRIPLMPVFGFLFQTFIGRKLPKPVVGFVSCGVILASAILAWVMFFSVKGSGHRPALSASLSDGPGSGVDPSGVQVTL